ncbi:VOC family protein [Nonomuraea sp. NPDC050663]|uniref:VOC family protein n=1 Tax=Nonomuraea sp. NPDC050663 TaxID=3364370 RepID=UPI0037A6F9D2
MPGIVRFRSTVLDCPDTLALGRFYAELLGWELKGDAEWAVVSDGSMRLAFQQVSGYRPPDWPDDERPQQFHLDLAVDDMEEAEKRALELGARKHEVQPSEDDEWRVYLDPVGHPFCLCR